MSTTDSFLPDPDRRISDSEQELAHEVRGDGPDVFADEVAEADSAENTQPLHPNPLFRTPHAGERLTAEQLEKELE